jgi:hypothetical protein
MPLFTPETGREARQRKAGLAAARYWRAQGGPNLERARERRSLNAALRREERLREEPKKLHTVIHPFGLAGVWYRTCGLSGYGGAHMTWPKIERS